MREGKRGREGGREARAGLEGESRRTSKGMGAGAGETEKQQEQEVERQGQGQGQEVIAGGEGRGGRGANLAQYYKRVILDQFLHDRIPDFLHLLHLNQQRSWVSAATLTSTSTTSM
eukprot:767953-Hanusia_phi.AAC.1